MIEDIFADRPIANPRLNESDNFNPGLEPYDLTDYTGIRGRNFFHEDQVLQRIFLREALTQDADHNRAMYRHIEGYGDLVGTILDELAEISHKENRLGYIEHFDRSGERIDEVRYCHEQIQARKISYEYGIVNLDFHRSWEHPFTMFHRMALAYLCNQDGEAGVGCPLAMTDGMIRAIKALGTPLQKELYLPLIAGPSSESYFMCGQYVTERVGGSNVGANRTLARRLEAPAGEAPGKWLLTGEKWFCSNPGDLWVTTARVDGTNRIGLFLVPRLRTDGSKNGYTLLRKKDIIGSRGKITAECLYENCEVEELGRPAHGIANLIRYVINISRIHVGAAAIGMSRRALMEALAYVRRRTAYGKRVVDFPVTKVMLAKMSILHTTVTLANFRSFKALDKKDPISELLTPMLKYISTVNATWTVRQSILLHGGNGILGDFSCLPRLLNDSVINETWEGAHPLIQEHVLKALSREKVRLALDQHIESVLARETNGGERSDLFRDLRQLYADWKQNLEQSAEWIDLNRKYITESLFYVYGLSLLIEEAVFDPALVSQKKGIPQELLWTGPEYDPLLVRPGENADRRNPEAMIRLENRIYAHMARGLIEIYRRGVDGATDPEGVFMNMKMLDGILAYMGVNE